MTSYRHIDVFLIWTRRKEKRRKERKKEGGKEGGRTKGSPPPLDLRGWGVPLRWGRTVGPWSRYIYIYIYIVIGTELSQKFPTSFKNKTDFSLALQSQRSFSCTASSEVLPQVATRDSLSTVAPRFNSKLPQLKRKVRPRTQPNPQAPNGEETRPPPRLLACAQMCYGCSFLPSNSHEHGMFAKHSHSQKFYSVFSARFSHVIRDLESALSFKVCSSSFKRYLPVCKVYLRNLFSMILVKLSASCAPL